MSAIAVRPRLGFLGVGWIGRMRLEALEASGVAEIAGIADPALPEALESLDDLLALDVDGVVIATPSALHEQQALTALEAGVAVFCQKPLALSAASAERVVGAARAADALLAVDLSYRFTAAARAVKTLVESGELGEIFAVELAFHNAYGPDKAWFSDPALAGGGCVLDLGIHLVDLALWTLGFPEVTTVRSTLHGAPVEHYGSAQLELENGASVRLACSWWLHAGRDCIFEASFYGANGGVSLRNAGGSFYDFTAERHSGTHSDVIAAPPDDWGGRGIVAWAEQVRDGAGFDPEVGGVVRVHDVLDRVYGR